MQYFTTIPLSEIPYDHPVREFDQYWGHIFENETSVQWSCFNPMKTPGVLPWILLLDCLEDNHYRYRVCGTGCQQLFGSDQTGKPFGSLTGGLFVEEMGRQFQVLKAGGGPMFHVGHLPIVNREHIMVMRGTYGFSTDGKTVDRILDVVAPLKGRRVAL